MEVRSYKEDLIRRRFFTTVGKHGKYVTHYGVDVQGAMSSLASWLEIRLIENPPQPWFCGDCPVPNNVKVRIWKRDGATFTTYEAENYRWSYKAWPGDIIAYQILSSDWQD